MSELRNLLLICFLLPLGVFAEEAPESSPAASGPQSQPQLFVVELTEIEDWNPDQLEQESNLDAKQLLRESRRGGSDRKRNTVKISAVEGNESYALFGSSVPVVVGWTTSNDKTEFDYEDEHIGTEIRVTVTRIDDGRLRVKLSFASSDVNLRPDGTEEKVDVITATATHTIEPGVPVVVEPDQQYSEVFSGGRSETLPRNSSVLILSVELAERDRAFNRRTHKRSN